jgi:hypothetical protein
MPLPQRVVQVCLFLLGAIALLGGSLQFARGQPHTEPRLDNVHRFMAGIDLGVGRLVSMARVGMPQPRAVWLGYLIPELVLPVVAATAQFFSHAV